ncbi:MAG: hypothetical protein DRP95_03775 [Candidatus Latescibacterota bacterium]|nr:MAG: hypothetical protein DRP95_03775 [Candidatus Latescibacterota bacterium]
MYGRTIEISVREPSGVPRKGYPLTCGVPFPVRVVVRCEGKYAAEEAERAVAYRSAVPGDGPQAGNAGA